MKLLRPKSTLLRLSAWGTLQALVAVQILPPFAYANELRAQSVEGTPRSGLEEALVTKPAGGFATRVERTTEKGVQVAKRAVGRLLNVQAGWDIGGGLIVAGLGKSPAISADDAISADRVIGWANDGLEWLRQHPEMPVIQRVWERLRAEGKPSLPVELRANHGLTMDFSDEDKAVRLDSSIASDLNSNSFAPGRRLLYAVGMFHEAAQAAGFSQREAAHLTLGLYQGMTPPEQKTLLEILRSPYVDHGDTWALFFEDASSVKEFLGKDTLALEERLDGEPSSEVRRQIIAVRNHRERWVSWLMGQLQIDLPYDRIAFRRAMEIGKQNVEAGRRAAYEVIRQFDRGVEQANAERMSAVVREHWLPEDLPYPVLLAGRESRAFGNQAQLFANSGYLLKTKEVVEAARLLHAVAQGEDLMDQLKKLESKVPVAAREDLGKAVKRVGELLAHLGPGADRIRQLVFGRGKVIPATQAAGALQQMRENTEIFYAQASKAIEQARDQVVNASTEDVGRRPSARGLDLPFRDAQQALSKFAGKGGELADLMERFRSAVQQAQSYAAAYSVLMQRPSPTGSEKFKGNELEEKPEQEEPLRKLTRMGGQNLYMSPSYDWVAEATDIIEAAPLFIYERTIEVDGKTVTVFEVDQEGLEQTVRQMAEYWAKNIDKTMDSEHLALAREIVTKAAPSSKGEAFRQEVARTAAWIAREFDRRIQEVERYTEKQWLAGNFIDRVAALRAVIARDPERVLAQARSDSKDLQSETERLAPLALARQRPLPAFHLLTTEAPGLVEGFIQAVLEEEMALRNVVKAKKLQPQVQQRMKGYAGLIQRLGWKVIQEFGYEPLVDLQAAQGLSREQAIRQVIGDQLPVQQELAKLAVLTEMDEIEHGSSARVDQILQDPAARVSLEQKAKVLVRNHNKNDPAFSEESDLYRQELEANLIWLAREQVLQGLDKQHPELYLQDRVGRWYRDHSALAQTAARREVIAANGLNGLMLDPRYAYSSGTIQETREGDLRPTGGRKRYHLVYAPSRVNLGKGERESVEVWPQWVGVTDPLAAAHAKAFYELINFNPQIRTIKEAENLKVSENQWTAMIRAVRNVQAYFVERMGLGDIEDLAYQFDQRNGLPGALLKQGESYQAGPTAGYCIPKDLLFKLFVATHQDGRKLSQIGLPQHLHDGVIRMMVELSAARRNFETAGEWEQWAAETLLSPQVLRKRFGAESSAISKHLAQYIEVTGGVPVFHLTKIQQLLQLAGVPNPLLARLQDLHAVLWSNWAEQKLTLPSEQVNRSLVFGFTRQIPEAVKEARRLNPMARVAGEEDINVHFYGTYKGDENAPSPPDVRYAWIMRAFMVLSGYGKEVALSLDEEGQLLAHLAWEGFNPDSPDPEDQKAARYLQEQFGSDPAAVARLKEAFPAHTTVGNITITVVPGVSDRDLLGFSHETHELLGNVATQVQELLQSKGISPAQMKANADLRRSFPRSWIPLSDFSSQEQDALWKAVAGKIHPLVLRLRGPGDNFLTDLQGQDVAVFSVTHPEIMQMDPAHLRDRMLVGRPNSALTALDFVAQGRHRVWFDRDVMFWYAAGRGVDSQGEPVADWSKRDSQGRRAVYRAFGFGTDEYRPLLGTDLRGEVARQENRAANLFNALEKVANAPAEELPRAVEDYRARFAESLVPERVATEAQMAVQYEQQMLMNRRFKPRDAIIREALVDLATGLAPEKLGEVHWLAAGGMFLLNGAPKERQEQVLAVIRKAGQRMEINAGMEESDPRVALLIQPGLTAAAIRLVERKGEMSSVKASETVVEKAVQRRKGLALEAARLAGLKTRQEGFISVGPVESAEQIPQALAAARQEVDRMLGEPQPSQRHVGVVMGITAQVLDRLAKELIPEEKERDGVSEQVKKLTQGREYDAAVWSAFGGNYENPGILARLFERAGEKDRNQVLAAMELLYLSFALEKTAAFLSLPAEEVDERLLLRALAGFFAETIDDHFYEYNPWALDPKRGSAFKEFYDELGVLKPGRAEELYRVSWEHHRAIYRYARQLVFTKTGARELSEPDRQALFGEVTLGDSPAQDRLQVQGIGAGAPGHYEQLWRAYNQLREMAFIRNDGFALPVVFERMDPEEPLVLNARRRVNHAFLSMVGRTHYSRALMEAGELGENLFITRDGRMATPPGVNGEVLQISDAQFWLTAAQYRQALIRFGGRTPAAADEQIARDQKEGRFTPKGIRAAARFTKPVTIGSVVPHHHHSLADKLWAAGYAGTDKSPGLYEMSYDKSLYPQIYNPPEQTRVHLPPEVDWHREDSEKLGEAKAKEAIAALIKPFAQQHGILVAKGSAESGARNFKRFDFVDPQGGLLTGEALDHRVAEAAGFIYEVSKGQNVTIQRAIIVTPISWMNPEAVQAFIGRQIRDWSVPVNLERHPKSWVYGTLRIILSSGVPKPGMKLDDPTHWVASHPISLASLQVATNVGRQGTLEMLTPEMVRLEFKETFVRDLEAAGKNAMAATARYGKKYWDEVYVPAYKAKHGVAPRELDATGVPYWWPRYLMLDFLPEPVWARDGQEVPGARVIDVIPGDPATGRPSRFILVDPQGKQFEGKVARFIFWLLEPNVGIGLWPNYWRREEVREKAAAKKEGRPVNWSNVGVSDRVVLGNYLAAGEAFLKAKFGGDYFGSNGPHGNGGPNRRPSPAIGPPSGTPEETVVADITDPSVRLSPPVDVLLGPGDQQLHRLLPHAKNFAVVTGKTTLMNHHLYPWIVAAQGRGVNVFGVDESWLTADGRASRLMALDPRTGHLVEFDVKEPVPIDHAFIVELPQSVEVEKHQQLTARLLTAGVDVVNPGGPYERERADDKGWLRQHTPQEVEVPETLLVDKGTPESRYETERKRLAAANPNGVVIQPRSGTTEGEGVRWFETEDRDGQTAYLETLVAQRDAMVSAYRGNVAYQGRPVVLRFNVAAGEVASATAVVGRPGEKIASLGRQGRALPLDEVLSNLEDSQERPVAVTEEAWSRLKETARDAAVATGLNVAGIDLVLEADGSGVLHGIVLEANARPGFLIFGEQVVFPKSGPLQSHPAPPAGDAFWNLVLPAGAEEAVTTEIREAAQRLGIELSPQWRGVSPKGLHSGHEPAILTLQWSPAQAVDSRLAVKMLSEKLPGASAHSSAFIQFTDDYLAVTLPRKTETMRDELVRELPGKKIALILGDSPTGDLLSREDLEKTPFPIPFVQVLVQGAATPVPSGYPQMVRAVDGPRGVEQLLGQLLAVARQNGRYEQVFGADAEGLPPGIQSMPVNLQDLVIFTDVDGTLMGSTTTFDESQAGAAGQNFSKERKDRIVELAKQGTDFRFITGKTGQEISFRRVRSDEDRLVKPLGEALVRSGVSPQKIGFDGVSGFQRGRFSPAGELEWRRADLPGGGSAFSDQEAARILRVMMESVESAARRATPPAAGAEEAITLEAWRKILADPLGSGFMDLLEQRYGDDDRLLLQALAAYQQVILGALEAGFDPAKKIVIVVASPGRDRVFMGHTDFPGLGGSTINVATQEEILAVLQATEDGQVHLFNSDPKFPRAAFSVQEIRDVAAKYKTKEQFFQIIPNRVWDSTLWDSYPKGALAWLISQGPGVDRKLGTSGVQAYFATVGEHALPPTGGMSSSSALTGAFSLGLNALFKAGLNLQQLAEVDYGEYLLGKSAGAGDKTAQLTAQRGEVVVVGSFPERALGTVRFPKGLTVLMAESPIPRLVTPAGEKWLEKPFPRFESRHAIVMWARGILRRFGSGTYKEALQELQTALKDKPKLRAAGITLKEARAVERALLKSVKEGIHQKLEPQVTDDQMPGYESFEYRLNEGLLRELAAGGAIEETLPELAGWENRHKRYDLIYRLLKLIPEIHQVLPSDREVPPSDLDYPRKAALFGIAELERGAEYLRELQEAVEAEGRADAAEKDKHVTRILDLVRWAHDGDRAVVDYRRGDGWSSNFGLTPWAGNARNDVSDSTIDQWIAGGKELAEIPGGFERSLPELDEMADEANQRFNGKVAMRVAAAGLGGAMAVHLTDDVVPAFTQWSQSKGWKVRVVKAGAPTQVIVPPQKRRLPGQLHLEGKEIVVRGEVPVAVLDPVHLPNGSWLSPERGTIVLSPGVKIGPSVVISAGYGSAVHLREDVVVKERTTVEGSVIAMQGSQLWGVVRGHPDARTVLGPGTQILSPNAFVDHGVITAPMTDEKGKRHVVKIYDARVGEEAGKGPVVIWGGTDLRNGVTVRANTILGPFVHLGPGSEAKATFWMGASANKNDSTLAHRGYGGNLVAIPVYLDGTPLDDVWHEQLFERLLALRFGRVVSREVERSTQAGPETRPTENVQFLLDGKTVPVSVRGINFGDEAGVSNFKSVSGGRKSTGVISAGVVAGVGAKVQTPVFVGPDSLIDDGAMAKRLQAAAPKTHVRPIGTTPDKAFRPGAVENLQGGGTAEDVKLFLGNLRTLQTLAKVSAAGLQRTQDPLTRTALEAEIQALKGHFNEIDGYTGKELELLGRTTDAAQVPALKAQADALRAGWAALTPSAGAEEEITQRFEKIAAELELPFDSQTPVFLWVGSHLGGGTIPMFNNAFAAEGRPLFEGKRPVALPMEIPEGEFDRLFPLLLNHPQVRGMDVTTPYKNTVAEKSALFGIELSETAKQVGSASLLVKESTPQGVRWVGSMLDGEGWVKVSEPDLPGRTFKGLRVVLFGAGGAGRAILAALAQEDRRPASLTVVEPDPARAEAARQMLESLIPPADVHVYSAEETASSEIRLANVVVNATDLGKLDDRTPVKDAAAIQPGASVFDLNWWRDVKGPSSSGALTPFLANAQRQGARVFNGLRMSASLNASFTAEWLGHPELYLRIYRRFYEKTLRDGYREAQSVGAEEALPRFSADELAGWVQRLSAEDPLYGWVTRLSADEQASLLQTLARAYGVFAPFMEQAAGLAVERRVGARVDQKLDKSAVTDVEHRIQRELNNLIRQFDSMSGVGEEGNVEVPDARYLVLSDPIDGTWNYTQERSHPLANRYSSAMTVLYRTDSGDWHPVLTFTVSPEYPAGGKPSYRLAAGVGIDGLWVNGRSTRVAEGRPLQDSVASFNVLVAEGKESYNRASAPYHRAYQQALKAAGAREIRQESDGITAFLLPLSVEDPGVPTLHLQGPAWDIFWLVHITQALGGVAYRMDQKTPFDLGSAAFFQPNSEANPPLLLSASPQAAKTLIEQYVSPAEDAGFEAPTRPEMDHALVILTPETAQAGIRALSVLRGVSDRWVRLAVIAADDRQTAQVVAELEPTGFRLEVPVVNLQETGWNLEQAIDHVQVAAIQKQFDPVVVRTLAELLDLGRLLLPEKSIKAWTEWLDRQGLSTQL